MKRFVGIYHISNAVTYLGIISAVTGIAFLEDITLIFDLKIMADIRSAMLCLVIAGICDLFDGVFARRFKRDEQTRAFGVQLDSLADTVSFIALPVCILLKLTGGFVLAGMICVFYALAGISRLAWFNITAKEHMTHYEGLPVTYAALIIPGAYIAHAVFKIPPMWLCPVMMVLYVVLAAAFISNIRIKKPRGIWYGVFSVAAVVWAALLILI